MIKNTIGYDTFEQLDLRVGKVIRVDTPEWSKKLLELTVDFGEEVGQRTIFSGIKAWYSAEDLIDRLFPFLINLAPKKMGEAESQGMMLMADGDQPVVLPLSSTISVGSVLR